MNKEQWKLWTIDTYGSGIFVLLLILFAVWLLGWAFEVIL